MVTYTIGRSKFGFLVTHDYGLEYIVTVWESPLSPHFIIRCGVFRVPYAEPRAILDRVSDDVFILRGGQDAMHWSMEGGVLLSGYRFDDEVLREAEEAFEAARYRYD